MLVGRLGVFVPNQGMIVDDEIYDLAVAQLPSGVKLTAVMEPQISRTSMADFVCQLIKLGKNLRPLENTFKTISFDLMHPKPDLTTDGSRRADQDPRCTDLGYGY